MEPNNILVRLETVLEVSLRDLETTKERVHTALDRAAAMSTDGLLSESEQYAVFEDIRALILEEETRAKKMLAAGAMLLDSTLRMQKVIAAKG